MRGNATVVLNVCETCTVACHMAAREDVELKQRAAVLICDYLRVLLWCLTNGLLPERQGNSPVHFGDVFSTLISLRYS